MRDFFTWRKALAIIGLLVIGAVGSSISDLIFKPLMVSLSDFFLNIATLGLSSVRDGMYQDIAKANYERTGAVLLASLMGIQLGIAMCLIIFVAVVASPRLTERLKEARFVSKDASSFRSFIYCWIGFMIVTTGFLTKSRTAQISKKGDFIAITDELKGIADANKLHTPTFDIF
jgi:hypothetical protein